MLEDGFTLLDWHEAEGERGGWQVVDYTFDVILELRRQFWFALAEDVVGYGEHPWTGTVGLSHDAKDGWTGFVRLLVVGFGI